MRESSGSTGHGAERISERDWKHLRVVHHAALERYCARILRECQAMLDDADLSAHERYLGLARVVRERDRELSSAFDDMRRSRAVLALAAMVNLDLVTAGELQQFSDVIRESAVSLAEIIAGE